MISSKEKAEMIRSGNRAFNEKDYPNAKKFFIKANYKSGLVRLGDYYMYEKNMPLLAYGYYKRADAKVKMDDIHKRMVLALTEWIGKDSLKQETQEMFSPQKKYSYDVDQSGMIPISVSPTLQREALYILKKQQGKNSLN